jgi:hypothetical protein
MLSVVLLGSPLPVVSQDAEKPRQEPSPPAAQEQRQTEPSESTRGLSIDHKEVGCVVAERFPVISARVDPAANVGRARVYFRAASGPHWYFVEMKAQGGGQYVSALPKPKKSTAQIAYYVEALDTAFAASRTAEYTPKVVSPPGACGKGGLMAVALTSAKLVVGAAVGAPAVPLGFSAAGLVTAAGGAATGGAVGASSTGGGAGAAGTGAAAGGAAAGGGISTGLIVGVVGAGAAIAGVAAATGGSKSTPTSSPATTQLPTTTPTLPPTTAPPSGLTGHWVGTGSDGFLLIQSKPGQPDCPVNLDVSLDISQSGSTLTGTVVLTVRNPGPCAIQDTMRSGTHTGSVSGSMVTMVITSPPPAPGKSTITFNLTGTVSGNRMSGALTGSSTNTETLTGTWAVNRQ